MPVESILGRTWGGIEPPPAEWVDFLLMRRMRWSWAQLQEAPMYVRRYCMDFLGLIAEAEEREQEKSKREMEAKQRTH
jgi:hypothetical protein